METSKQTMQHSYRSDSVRTLVPKMIQTLKVTLCSANAAVHTKASPSVFCEHNTHLSVRVPNFLFRLNVKATNVSLHPSFIALFVVLFVLTRALAKRGYFSDSSLFGRVLLPNAKGSAQLGVQTIFEQVGIFPALHCWLLLPEAAVLSFCGQWTGKADSEGREITLILCLTLTQVLCLSFLPFSSPSSPSGAAASRGLGLWPRCQGHRWELGKVDLFQTIIEITSIS